MKLPRQGRYIKTTCLLSTVLEAESLRSGHHLVRCLERPASWFTVMSSCFPHEMEWMKETFCPSSLHPLPKAPHFKKSFGGLASAVCLLGSIDIRYMSSLMSYFRLLVFIPQFSITWVMGSHLDFPLCLKS